MIEICKVDIEDAKELLEIYSPYVEKTAISFEYDIPSVEEFTERIKDITSKYPYLKAVENGKILGYAYANTFKGRRAYDWSVETTIYIKEECRGNNIGRMLYDALEKSLADMNILNANACIASPKGDDPYVTDASIKFHEKMGYRLVGKFTNSGFKFNTWYDMVWMEKELGKHKANPDSVRFGYWQVL